MHVRCSLGPETQRRLNKWELYRLPRFLPLSLSLAFPLHILADPDSRKSSYPGALGEKTHFPKLWLFSAWKLKSDSDISFASEGRGTGRGMDNSRGLRSREELTGLKQS